MNLGNKSTYYHISGNSEHALVNTLHAEITSGAKPTNPQWLVEMHSKLTRKNARENYRLLLQSYIAQAKEYNWHSFGIKTTTGHNPSTLFELMKMHEEEWGTDVQYLTTLRHPFGAYVRLRKKNLPQAKDEETVYQNWLSHVLRKLVILQKGGIVVRYPEHFQNGGIKKIVERIGLSWNETAGAVFQKGRVTSIGAKEAEKCLEDRPNLAAAYNLLLGAADG
jgi:hypothetical protein